MKLLEDDFVFSPNTRKKWATIEAAVNFISLSILCFKLVPGKAADFLKTFIMKWMLFPKI